MISKPIQTAIFSQSATPTINEPSGNKVPSNKNTIKNKAEKTLPEPLSICHLVTTEEGCAQWGYVNSSKTGRLQPLPASTGREGAHCVSVWKKGNSQCKGPGGVQGKARGVRGLEWEAGRVVGTGLGYHSEGSRRPSGGSEQKSNLDLKDSACKAPGAVSAHSKCSVNTRYCHTSPLEHLCGRPTHAYAHTTQSTSTYRVAPGPSV